MGNLKQAHTYLQPKQGLTCQNPFDKLSLVAAFWVPVYTPLEIWPYFMGNR